MLIQRNLVLEQSLVTGSLVFLLYLAFLEHTDFSLHDHDLPVEISDVLGLEVALDISGVVLIQTPPLLLDSALEVRISLVFFVFQAFVLILEFDG